MPKRITSQRELSREMAERLAARADWISKHPEDAVYKGKVENVAAPSRLICDKLIAGVDAVKGFAGEVEKTASKVAAALDREAVRKLRMTERAHAKAEKRSKSNQTKGRKARHHGRKDH